MTNNTIISKKICILGKFGVGKTSLIRQFVHGIYDDSYLSTIGVKISQKLLPPTAQSPGKFTQINLMVWDIEGFEKDSRQLRSYLTGAAGAVLVADLTRKSSVELLPEIHTTVHAVCPEAPVIVLGNKQDLITGESKLIEELASISEEMTSEYMLSSAKTGLNVNEAFAKLGALIAK